ncbi:MAG: MogA/MoaB family molybdenum cofactor biosynthesis protein [Verrucomicrobiota bacterium]
MTAPARAFTRTSADPRSRRRWPRSSPARRSSGAACCGRTSARSSRAALRDLVDRERCRLVVTTGGTGPNRRDVTPEATRAVLELELPGFGEIMRARTFDAAPTAILSRATAGIRRACLIVNLPGRPSAVAECLAVLGPAIKKALELLEMEYRG